MKKQIRMSLMMIVFWGWVFLFLGSAQAAVIANLDPNNRPVTGNPTITILDSSGADITGTWLPEPGQTVMIQVNGVAVTSLQLSAATGYPGVCTNFGTDTGPDFTLNGSQLTSNDCGGTATILVNGSYVFKVPQDSNNNGIPDVWENKFGANLDPGWDYEPSPSTTDATQPTSDSTCLGSCREGDGIAAFDEYRGFIVSATGPDKDNLIKGIGFDTSALKPNTMHIRTNPLQKDLFVHVVNNQCASTPPQGNFARYFPSGGQFDMFAALYTMLPGTQIHFLDYTPGSVNPTQSSLWEDYFDSYSVTDPDGTGTLKANSVVFVTPSNVKTNKESDVPTDRRINKNARYPITDLATLQPYQKGVRLIECQVVDALTTLGVTDWGTPNKAGSKSAIKTGNSVIFPERIRKDVQTKLTNAGARSIYWAISNSPQSWVTQPTALAPNSNLDTQDFLARRQIQYLVAHEIGHASRLRPTSTNGYHTTAGYGSEMDATIQVSQDTSTSGKTTFDIPSQFITTDQVELRFKN
jgi:hypothetical protein